MVPIMVRKLNLEEKRGWAKPASASGDTQRRRRNVSITSGKSPAGRQRSGKVVNKVGKSALASGDEHAAVLRRPAACQASDSPVSASGDRAITSVFCHGVRVRCYAAKRQELKDAIQVLRSSRSGWDLDEWRLAVQTLKSKGGFMGPSTHGGDRRSNTGKRKSTDRDSDHVLASGSKNRDKEQLASGNKDRGIEQLAPGNKDRDIDQLAHGSKDRDIEQVVSGNKGRGIEQLASGNKGRGIEQLASGNKGRGIEQLAHGSKDRDIEQVASGIKDRGIQQLASGNKDRSSGRGVASESSAPGDTQHDVGTGKEQPRLASASESLAICTTDSMVVRLGLGYRLLGPAAGRGSFGSVFPVIWKDMQDHDDLGELAVVKRFRSSGHT